MLSLIHGRNTLLNPRLPSCSRGHTFKRYVPHMQVFLADCFDWIRSLPNVLFVPCMSLCQEATSSGVPVPKRRAPRSTKWSLWGPAQSFRHTQSITQLSAEDWEGRLLQPLGWAWPPCWVRHCHACTRARPALHNAAVEPRVATAFLSSAMALMMATGRPLWARLIPEAETRLQYPWMSKYPANRTLP